jgi:hypothetical protein
MNNLTASTLSPRNINSLIYCWEEILSDGFFNGVSNVYHIHSILSDPLDQIVNYSRDSTAPLKVNK